VHIQKNSNNRLQQQQQQQKEKQHIENTRLKFSLDNIFQLFSRRNIKITKHLKRTHTEKEKKHLIKLKRF